MQIKINNEIDRLIWNRLVDNKAMLMFEWFDIIFQTYNLKPFYVLYLDSNLFALIGSFETNNGFISLPFLTMSGYCSNDETTLLKLQNFIISKNIDIDARSMIALEESPHFVTSIIEISSIDSYVKSLSTNMRNQITRSQKFGFVSDICHDINDEIYTLYVKAMYRLGTPAHKKLFFEKILEHIKNNFILTIFDNNKLIGFMFCVYDDDTVYDLFAATDIAYKKEYANYLLYLEALKQTIKIKKKYFDMGRSTYKSGVHEFKQKWKPKDYSITSTIAYNKSGVLGFASFIWKKLPYALIKPLGPCVRKYLP